MSTDTAARTGTYEGMFLVTQAAAAAFGECVEHINHLFERADATVIAMKKWDERRLAYDIDGSKRGVYFHVYFKADASKLAGLERDCNLSEMVIRSMVLRADHHTEEEVKGADARQQLDDEIKVRAAGESADAAPAAS